MSDAFNKELPRNAANFQALTPLSFLARAAEVFPNHTAIIHGKTKQNYEEFYANTRRLASALSSFGIKRGDVVSTLLPNIPPMLDAHYGVPMCQAVLHAINIRLDAKIIAFQIDHARSKLVIVDSEYLPLLEEALARSASKPKILLYHDFEHTRTPPNSSYQNYLDFLASGEPDYKWHFPEDEWDAISINYTSGTTGDPKGVVYHHRGAYLLAQGNAMTCAMPKHPVYLWTLPMFHCNGWCFPWTISATIGTHICLRQVRAEPMWEAMKTHKVTHLCGAPIVMTTLIDTHNRPTLDHEVQFLTAAAPPPETVLAAMQSAGFNVVHLYGLTETYGPAVVNEWQNEWGALDSNEQATKKARQGVRYLPLEGLDVLDPNTMKPVLRDGQSLGEVMIRGNVVMKGYYRNPKATKEAFEGGWFHSGDLGVVHEDGYIQLKDRSKDIIISGGENISSIEIEDILYHHPKIAVAAVVAKPDDKWGETPCAFIETVEGEKLDADEMKAWCKERLAGYKVPSQFIFQTIPRTSTGKIQKFVLREEAKNQSR